MGYRSFMAAVPRVWNSLPLDTRSAKTTSDFKQRLFNIFFQEDILLA